MPTQSAPTANTDSEPTFEDLTAATPTSELPPVLFEMPFPRIVTSWGVE